CHALGPECRRQDVKMSSLHYACQLTVMAAAGIKPKEDASLPVRYCQLIWDAAYAQGYLPLAWCNSRWAAGWRGIVDCGYLDVTDTTYWHAEDVKFSKCMQWGLKAEFNWFLQQEQAAPAGKEVAEGEKERTGQQIATGVSSYVPRFVLRRYR